MTDRERKPKHDDVHFPLQGRGKRAPRGSLPDARLVPQAAPDPGYALQYAAPERAPTPAPPKLDTMCGHGRTVEQDCAECEAEFVASGIKSAILAAPAIAPERAEELCARLTERASAGIPRGSDSCLLEYERAESLLVQRDGIREERDALYRERADERALAADRLQRAEKAESALSAALERERALRDLLRRIQATGIAWELGTNLSVEINAAIDAAKAAP